MQVLIVDDDDFAIAVLESTLTRMGYSVVATKNGREAMDVLRLGEIRLVITDWDMPGMNGIELCRAIRREDLSGYVYIIMLTGREGAKQRIEGLCTGADDFMNKPLDPEELLVCLKTAERILSLETRDLALFSLAKLAESRDSETGSHIERVQTYTRLIARNLSPEVRAHYGVDDDYIRLLYQTSPLHDLGKVGIPDSVLLKPGKLTPDEFEVMKTHAILGAKTLDAALERFPSVRFLQLAREIAISHHEKFDGSGYPQGLAGEQIPICGRIVAVADVYDALTSRRVYKEAMSHADAREILLRDRGSHFDPEVIQAFVRAEPQILEVWERMRDEVRPAAAEVSLPTQAAALKPSAAPCNILVAEDDPVLRNKLIELLTATGATVLAAADGLEAMKIWDAHRPRVVVSDWMMPGADGIELCRHIRAVSGVESAHFIMLTAHADKSRLLDAYNSGTDDFVSKPFDCEELLARVRAGIRTARLHDELLMKARGSQAVNAQLAIVNSRLERLSITDELTGLFNRRHAMFRMEEQWALSERYGKALSICMIDVDHFKRINDTLGHDAGDSILRGVANVLREQTRGTDAVCRVGGEEFLIVFPLQGPAEARICAERCRAAVEAHKFIVAGKEARVTVSAGVASRVPELCQFTDLLRIADQALYAAKHEGRNRVLTHEERAALEASRKAVEVAGGESIPGLRAHLDMSKVIARCGGDEQFAAAVAIRFHDQAPMQMSLILKAVNGNNSEELSRAAHSLKSMAAYVSADVAANLAAQIEELGRKGAVTEAAPLCEKLKEEIDAAIRWIGEHGPIVRAPAA